MSRSAYDAIVVGAGPNGLAAAITLQRVGLSVLLLEAKSEIGGGARSAELTLPGFIHDVCAAVHPMAGLSPFFNTVPLQEYGLEWIHPDLPAAHPLEGGSAGFLHRSVAETARGLGADAAIYERLMGPLVADLPKLIPGLLSPHPPLQHPLALAGFGWNAIQPASWLVRRFKTDAARALWAGMAAHAMQPLENFMTSAFGIMLMAAGHMNGWPIAKGGSGALTHALAKYFHALGGTIETQHHVRSIHELPSAKAVLFDVTPRQLLAIAGDRFSKVYAERLTRYRYGMGVFKIDWALSEQIPFRSEACRRAGTVHLGGTYEEVAKAEREAAHGLLSENPFVLLSQPSVVDSSRAPSGKHTAWAYCHVPHGDQSDRTRVIENQVERFAPGFKDVVMARHTFNSGELEAYNPNYVGGDINGGVQDIYQHFSRPILSSSPYRTSARGIYLCSSSTPPGGGVHGMPGYHAALRALQDRVFD